MSAKLETLLTPYADLSRVIAGILAAWPQHRAFLTNHIGACGPERLKFLDLLSFRCLQLIGGDLAIYCSDYHEMCTLFMKYELQYRRRKAIEYGSFAEIMENYYRNDALMGVYMRGLMISQVAWRQHAGAASFFAERFLPMLAQDYDYLEIGPGHGLWLSFAATDPRCRSLTGWDVAQASLGLTRRGLDLMSISRDVDLTLQDICAPIASKRQFDAIVVSQVLELVSSPADAIRNLADRLRLGGLIFVNAPTGMLAPDHIRIWANHHEVDGHLASAGLAVVERELVTPDADAAPDANGYSYLAIARKPRPAA